MLIASAAYTGDYARFDGLGDLSVKHFQINSSNCRLLTRQLQFRDIERLGADMHQHFESNVMGNINLFNLFVPLIRNGNLKKVVAISTGLSDLDLIRKLRIANAAPYSITKAALNMVVAKFHAQYADEGILFMAICPGSVATGNFDNRKSLVPAPTLNDLCSNVLSFLSLKLHLNKRPKQVSCFKNSLNIPLISQVQRQLRTQSRMSFKLWTRLPLKQTAGFWCLILETNSFCEIVNSWALCRTCIESPVNHDYFRQSILINLSTNIIQLPGIRYEFPTRNTQFR